MQRCKTCNSLKSLGGNGELLPSFCSERAELHVPKRPDEQHKVISHPGIYSVFPTSFLPWPLWSAEQNSWELPPKHKFPVYALGMLLCFCHRKLVDLHCHIEQLKTEIAGEQGTLNKLNGVMHFFPLEKKEKEYKNRSQINPESNKPLLTIRIIQNAIFRQNVYKANSEVRQYCKHARF